MVDAFDKGYYWAVIENIDQADDKHIEKLAEAFNYDWLIKHLI